MTLCGPAGGYTNTWKEHTASGLKIILEMEIVYSSETMETNVGEHSPENTMS
jgi:hypothetical protein